jgi:hypothetical protein
MLNGGPVNKNCHKEAQKAQKIFVRKKEVEYGTNVN